MPKHKLKWLKSYETLKFNTEDGDIDGGQFCRWKERYLVRKHPKNNSQWSREDDLDITGMEEVFVEDAFGGYYDVFLLPNGRHLRIPSTMEKYHNLRKIRNYPQPQKNVTDEEIGLITKKDHLWL